MQKLREDIRVLNNQSSLKLVSYRERISVLHGTVRFFSQTCELVSSAHQLDSKSGDKMSH